MPRLIGGATRFRKLPHMRQVGTEPLDQPGPVTMIGQTVAELLDARVSKDFKAEHVPFIGVARECSSTERGALLY